MNGKCFLRKYCLASTESCPLRPAGLPTLGYTLSTDSVELIITLINGKQNYIIINLKIKVKKFLKFTLKNLLILYLVICTQLYLLIVAIKFLSENFAVSVSFHFLCICCFCYYLWVTRKWRIEITMFCWECSWPSQKIRLKKNQNQN